MKSLDLNYEFDAEIIKDLKGAPQRIKGLQDILLPAIAQLPQGGMDFVSMEPRITLIQRIKSAFAAKQSTLLLENGDHVELVKALKAQKFALADVNIHEYVRSVIDLPDVKMEVAKLPKAKTKGNAA